MSTIALKDIALTRFLGEHEYGILSQIKTHCESVWGKDVFPHAYATIHGLPHSVGVIKMLDLMLKPYMVVQPTSKRLNSSEILILLGAAFLHDIGYLPCEPRESLEVVHSEHHNRGHKYILDEMLGALIKDDVGRTYLDFIARLVKGHRSVPEKIGKFRNGAIGSNPIRVQFLIALLRFADELDVGKSRANEALLDFVQKTEEKPPPEHTILQWVRHFYTIGVHVDSQLQKGLVRVKISVSTLYPEGKDDYEHYFIKPWILQPIKRAVLETYFALAEEGIILDHKVDLVNDPGKIEAMPEQIYSKCQQRVIERESLESLIRYNHKRKYAYAGAVGQKSISFNAHVIKVKSNVSYTLVNTSEEEKYLGNNGIFLKQETEILDSIIPSTVDESVIKRYLAFRISVKWDRKPVNINIEYVPFLSKSDDPIYMSATALRDTLSGIADSKRKKWSFRNTMFCAYRLATEDGGNCLHTRFIYLEPITSGANVCISYAWLAYYLPWDLTIVGYNLLTKGTELKFLNFPKSYVFTMSRSLRLAQNGLPNGKTKIVSAWENKRAFREAQMLEAGSQIIVWWRDKNFPKLVKERHKSLAA
jgi:hypothetical protein